MKDQALCNLLPRFKGPVGHMEVCRQAAERIAVLSPEMNPKLGSPQRVTNEQIALAQFTEYFVKNYPGPNTIITRPEWHAPKIFAAAKRAILSAPPVDHFRDATEMVEASNTWNSSSSSQPQEAKPVAADRKVRFAFENIRNNYVGWQDNSNFDVLERALFAAAPQEPVPTINQFMNLHGYELSKALRIDAYDIADRDAKIKAVLLSEREPALRPSDDKLWDQTLSERDYAEELGTRLAEAVGEYFRVDVNEHSNLNDPRLIALAILGGEYVTDSDNDRRIKELEATPAAVPHGWKLVPLKPTEDMHGAAVRTISGNDDFPPRIYAALLAAAPTPPAAPEVDANARDAIRKIGREIAIQDNRITDAPIFIVQQKRSYVGHPDYNECRIEWRMSEDECLLASRTYARELETHYRHTGEEKKGWNRLAVFDVWEFVTACFTEQGCKDYLAINAHNLNEPRIYAEGSYRNHEYRTVRNYLIGLADKPADKDF